MASYSDNLNIIISAQVQSAVMAIGSVKSSLDSLNKMYSRVQGIMASANASRSMGKELEKVGISATNTNGILRLYDNINKQSISELADIIQKQDTIRKSYAAEGRKSEERDAERRLNAFRERYNELIQVQIDAEKSKAKALDELRKISDEEDKKEADNERKKGEDIRAIKYGAYLDILKNLNYLIL